MLGDLVEAFSFSMCVALSAANCLPGAHSPEGRQNISIDGVSSPIKILYGDWASSLLLAEVVGIVLREKMDFNAQIDHTLFTGSSKIWMAMADCTQYNWAEPCNPGRFGLKGHLVFDIWDSYSQSVYPRLLADVPERLPIRAPYPEGIGLTGTEGMFLGSQIVNEALDQRVCLEWYEVYNASWNLTKSYFTSHFSLPVPDTPCSEVQTLGSEFLQNYINVTGDVEVANLENGHLVPFCHNNWMLSKTCRERMKNGDGCIALVSSSGWGYVSALQLAFWHGMPIALGSYSNANWTELSSRERVLFYWWQPDNKFIQLNAKEIRFPQANFDEHNLGIFKTMAEGSRIYNLMNAAVPQTEPLLMKFMDKFQISIQSVTSMMREYEIWPAQEVACRWLRANEASWERWVPVQACVPGQGLQTDAQTGRKHCSWCVPGTASDNDQHCQFCAKGKYQEQPGQSTCVDCESGKYASEEGYTACKLCEPGRYEPISGSSACNACNRSSTTRFYGSADLNDCVCQEGTYFDQRRNLCMPCSELATVGLTCPGGYAVFSSQGVDLTPRLQPGYMTLANEPFLVYTCVDKEARCPGERVPGNIANMCGGSYDPSAARCSRCKSGFYQSSRDDCSKCDREDSAGIILILKCVAAMVIEFAAVMYMYFRFNRPNPSGLITLALLISYVQVVQQIGTLPLLWPDLLLNVFNALNVFTIDDFLGFLAVRNECIAGSSLWTDLGANLLAPPTLILHLALGWVIARLVRRPLKLDCILNTIGLIVKSVFLTIASMPLRLFVTEVMPGGQVMVKTLPDVRVGSEEWLQAVPVAILAFLAYCIAFIAYVAHAVVKAPRWAASWPAFGVRYRFAFGVLRPDRWWWCLVHLCFSLSVMVAQVATPSAHLRLYTMIVIVEIYTIACFQVYPFKFVKNNLVELTLQCSLLIVLVISTSFLDISSLTQQELLQMRDGLAIFVLVMIIIALLHALQGFAAWLLEAFLPKIHHRFDHRAQVYKLAMDFRDLAADICLLPDSRFLSAVNSLSEVDQIRLRTVMLSLVPTFLKLQPAPQLWKQRLIPGVPFEVWDRLQTTMRTLQTAVDNSGQTMATKNAVARLQLMILADEVRKHSVSSRKIRTTIDAIRTGKERSSVGNIMVFPPKATADEFCESLGSRSCLTEDELKNVYNLINFSGDDAASVLELTVALKAGAPRLSEEQSMELHRLRDKLGPSHSNTQRTSLNSEDSSDGGSPSPAVTIEHELQIREHTGNASSGDAGCSLQSADDSLVRI